MCVCVCVCVYYVYIYCMHAHTTEVNPRSAEAFNNLGVIYKDMDNLPRVSA